MTALFWSTLRARLGTAVIGFLLAVCAAAAAAAGPTYADAAGRAVTRTEVEAAPLNERVIRASKPDLRGAGEQAPSLPVVDGVTTVFSRFVLGRLETLEAEPRYPAREDSILTSRTGACAHMTMQSGRCAVAENEINIREDTARELGIGTGQELAFRYLSERRLTRRNMTVVGVYRYLDVNDPFWAGHPQLLGVNSTGAVFTSEYTLMHMRGEPMQRVDLVLRPEADPVAIREDVVEAIAQFTSGDFGVNTDFLDLADRVQHSRDMLSAKLIGGVAPLVLVCWFVLFFAVSSAVRHRQEELGLYALRGVPTPLRLALPALEIAGPLVLGAVPGYLLGHLAVRLSYPDARITQTALIACAAAILGAVAAGVIAIFRRVRTRASRPMWIRAVEIGVATLALAVGYQASLSGVDASGPSMLAPLCTALGVGILAARLLPTLTSRLGRALLRRGKATAALSLLALARRPGTAPVAILLTVVFGLSGHAAGVVLAADRSWEQRAAVQTGAARVLSIASAPPGYLMEAVRAADPSGRHAMAVALLARPDTGPILAVDSSRLAAVANWPADLGQTRPQDLAQRLHPEPARPIVLDAKGFTLTVTLAETDPLPDVRVRMRFLTRNGSAGTLESERLQAGTGEYRFNGCERCTLESLEFFVGFADRNAKIDLVIGPMRTDSGDPLWTAGLGWHPSGVQTTPRPEGVGVTVNVPASNARIYPAVLPSRLPMAGSVVPPQQLSAYADAVHYPIADAGRLPLVPRFGKRGLIMDLEYAMHGPSGGGGTTVEVWLADGAPAEVVERLRAAGLDIVDDRTAAQQYAALTRQAPAAALRFVVVAALAWLALGLAGLLVAAAFERGASRLTVLRTQGVSERMLRRAALGSRLVLLCFAFVWSIVAFGMTWGVAYDILPPFMDRSWPAAGLPLLSLVPLAVPALIAAIVVCWASARVSYAEELPS